METKEKKTIVQKIKLSEADNLSIAQRYYSLLSAISNAKLTKREIQLIAFIAIKGNIYYPSNREEFCYLYKSSFQSINNMISKLRKVKIIVKETGKTNINPQFLLDFEKDIILQISLLHG